MESLLSSDAGRWDDAAGICDRSSRLLDASGISEALP